MKEKIDRIVNSRFGVEADKFYNSVWYVIAVGAICCIAHIAHIPAVGVVFLTLLLLPALLVCKNSFVLLPPLFMFGMIMGNAKDASDGYANSPAKLAVLSTAEIAVSAVFLSLLGLALVFNVLYYGKYKLLFKRAYLTISLAIMSGALIMGGIGAPTFDWHGTLAAVRLGIITFVPYALLVNSGEYKGKKTVEYFAQMMIVTAVAMFFIVLVLFFGNDFIIGDTNLYRFGMFGPNTGSAVVVIALPVTFYYVYSHKYGYLFMGLVVVELLTIFLCFSRASLLIAVPGTIIVALALCFVKKDGRLAYWITVGVLALALIVVALVLRRTLFDTITGIKKSGDSGRFEIWRDGFMAWKSRPILGVGLYYLLVTDKLAFYSFHCTPLTYLYCAGIIGLAAYVYHRYTTVRLVFSAKLTAERVFVALSVLAMLLNALLDVAMTKALHLTMYATMLALIECDVRKMKEQAQQADSAAAEQIASPAERSEECALTDADGTVE